MSAKSYAYEYENVQDAVGTLSSDGEIIAAPGTNRRLVLIDGLLNNEDASNTDVVTLDEDTTAFLRFYLKAEEAAGFGYNLRQERRLAVNTALNASLNSVGTLGYSIRYYVEQVG